MELKNKKVLMVGLGILGGGVATAKWLLEQGAELTITDLKNQDYLKSSIEKLSDFEGKFKAVFSEHRKSDFLENEIIVINPDVPIIDNEFLKVATEAGKQIENELTLFFKFAKCKTTIGITGTRGKTTTTNWIGHILKNSGYEVKIIGNDPEKPFMSEIKNCGEKTIAVIEMPSFQLEILGRSGLTPHIAVVTNIYQDHLSRHKTMQNYALAKAGIFQNQTEKDFIILNKENEWTKFLLDLKPKGKVTFTSDVNLRGFNTEDFSVKYGSHNLQNFCAAAAACISFGISEKDILDSVKTLPTMKWRQELVYDKKGLKIYNDTASTSPEALIASMERFLPNDNAVFISGGTDRELDFELWGIYARKKFNEKNLILLCGSATEKMKKELKWKPKEFETIAECFAEALKMMGKIENSAIIFSPGAKSFEKFKNEFDRGEQFNNIVKSL